MSEFPYLFIISNNLGVSNIIPVGLRASIRPSVYKTILSPEYNCSEQDKNSKSFTTPITGPLFGKHEIVLFSCRIYIML